MKRDFFQKNRHALSEATSGGLVVLTAHDRMQSVVDTAYPFTQESNFWYLCGIVEPGWQLIIDGTRGKSWLVEPNISDVERTFDGGISAKAAREMSGVDEVVAEADRSSLLRQLRRSHAAVYGLKPESPLASMAPNPAPKRCYDMLERTFERVLDVRRELATLRAIKSPDEITAHSRAIDLTIEGYERIKRDLSAYRYEYEIESTMTHYFRSRGAMHAYTPIVASGQNACTLHYTANDSKLHKRTLVLCDIGAAVEGHAADISRTFAISEPTKRQRSVHAAVERATQKIIALLHPGLRFEAYMQAVDDVMREEIVALGYGNVDVDTVRKYMPHAVSHGLGIDVHDSFGAYRQFEPGMLLTVEPGLYFGDEGLGVRIEENIVITEHGAKNLSRRLSTGL